MEGVGPSFKDEWTDPSISSDVGKHIEKGLDNFNVNTGWVTRIFIF